MKKAHVLVIEDDHALSESLKDLLEIHDCNATTVLTGQEGLAVLRKEKPDLILLDIRLPDMTGYDFLATVRESESDSKIPVLILTASERLIEIAKNSGLSREKVFFKPETKISDLVKAIQTELSS